MDDYESFDDGDRPHWISRLMEHVGRPSDNMDGFILGLCVVVGVGITVYLYVTGG